MKELIGISHLDRINSSLKREALLFDRVGILRTNLLDGSESHYLKHSVLLSNKELEWLLSKEIVFFPSLENDFHSEGRFIISSELKAETQRIARLRADLERGNDEFEAYTAKNAQIPGVDCTSPELVDMLIQIKSWELQDLKAKALDSSVRFASVLIREDNEADVVPLIQDDLIFAGTSALRDRAVFHLTLDKLPIPDELTSWEQIIEFRQDDDSRGKFLSLRRWMSKVTREDLKPNEIEQELEWLLYDYERHFKLHEMRTDLARFEAIITIVPEMLEHLVRLEFGQAARSVFAFQKKKIDLLEEEMKLPSSEVAYVMKAREEFE